MITQYPEEGGKKAKQKKSIANVQKKKKEDFKEKKRSWKQNKIHTKHEKSSNGFTENKGGGGEVREQHQAVFALRGEKRDL